MKWRIKNKILNGENVFIYSSRRVQIESIVQLNEEQLTKICNIIEEENNDFGNIAARIVCEIGSPIKGAGCGFIGSIRKKTYIDINTKRAMCLI